MTSQARAIAELSDITVAQDEATFVITYVNIAERETYRFSWGRKQYVSSGLPCVIGIRVAADKPFWNDHSDRETALAAARSERARLAQAHGLR